MLPLAETYTQLMTNPPHLLFEVTMEVLTGALIYPLARRARRSWSRSVHADIDLAHGIVHTPAHSPAVTSPLVPHQGGHVRLIEPVGGRLA